MSTISENTSIPPSSSQPAGADFTNISLEGEKLRKKKEPRRILHFSDGVLEEYSTDEEEDAPLSPPVDPKTLTWGPWMWYYISTAGWRAFTVADACGEKLAWFFGITSPKYQAAIDEFYRLKHEEEKEREQEERRKQELAGLTGVNVEVKSGTLGSGDTVSSVEKY